MLPPSLHCVLLLAFGRSSTRALHQWARVRSLKSNRRRIDWRLQSLNARLQRRSPTERIRLARAAVAASCLTSLLALIVSPRIQNVVAATNRRLLIWQLICLLLERKLRLLLGLLLLDGIVLVLLLLLLQNGC